MGWATIVTTLKVDDPANHLIGSLLIIEPCEPSDNLSQWTHPRTAIRDPRMMRILMGEAEKVIIVRDDHPQFALCILPMRRVSACAQM